MAKKVSNIHDKFIKTLLSDKAMAVDFFKEMLPETVVKHLIPDSLEQLSETYVTEQLEESFSDLVWRVKTKDNTLRICLLLEHKSYKDPKVTFQILEYLALAYRKQLKMQKRPELIVPILYYHGNKKWELKTLSDFFKDYPDELLKYLPGFESIFIDLNRKDKHELEQIRNKILYASLLTMMHSFNQKALKEDLKTIFRSLEIDLDKNIINSIFVYVLQVADIEPDQLNQIIVDESKDLKDKIMSTYDYLIQEGIEKGIEKGIEQTILNAYANKIDLETIRLITGKSIEEIKAIIEKEKKH